MEFSNREFSFMETSFPEIFCQGFFFHGKFFSWNFPFHEIKIFPGIFLIMENSFHGICFHSIFFLKFSFMEKKFMENSCSSRIQAGVATYVTWLHDRSMPTKKVSWFYPAICRCPRQPRQSKSRNLISYDMPPVGNGMVPTCLRQRNQNKSKSKSYAWKEFNFLFPFCVIF